ncbi:MAG: DUF5696 domain-containing protein [Lachnospiraceae bacterium]|jgi:hypothetical protein|nr:DUF5696 domain-containing protein [Lachnospiraceae bacterium]
MKAKKSKVKIKKQKMPMSLLKKILLFLAALALVCGLIYLVFYLFYYVLYNRYQDFLTDYTVEEGTQFRPLTDSVNHVPGFELAAENEVLKLYTDLETANVAIYDKRSGVTHYTNPLDAEADAIANNVNINYLKSQMIVTYFNRMVRTGIFDSYSTAVEKGQYEIESLENGLRYRYRLGDLPEGNTGTIPLYISPELLEKLTGQMSENDALSFTRIYRTDSDISGTLQLNPVVQNNPRQMARMQGILEDLGWTEDDFLDAMEGLGDLVEAVIPISFSIALDYRLDGDALVVSIPVSEIQTYGGGSIQSIQLLRYLGAGNMEETGYFVVPNGSGALIHFNNGKQHYPTYQQSIYGVDPVSTIVNHIEYTETVKLALFGICREDSTILATIEDGRTLSSITAVVAGTFSEYNYIFNTFILGNADNLYMFGTSALDVFVKEPEMYDVNLTVRYSFPGADYRGYTGLANYYREKLIEEGKLTPAVDVAQADEPIDIPFYYDVIGGVKETNHILGKQYFRVFPMTTFDEALLMSEQLREMGIATQVMNFQGWFNGGYYNNATTRLQLTRKLGSKRDLEELSAYITNNGGRFYADVALQKVTWADRRFNYNAVASRYFGPGFVAGFGQTHPTMVVDTAMGYVEILYNYISPKFLPRYVESFTKKVNRYDIDGISLRDLTDNLSSDKRRSNIINREKTLEIILGQFDLLATTDMNLMGNAAYDYSFPYLTDIINVPTSPNRYFIIDEDIPLYEMIIHGSIDYAGLLLNFNADEDKANIVLNLIEYGASPHYAFTWQPSSLMKNTGLSRYYNTTFNVWKEEAFGIYTQVNAALSYVSGAQMIDHRIMGDVRAVTYSNGITIYVNYGNEDLLVGNKPVPARSYFVDGIDLEYMDYME